MLGLRRGFVWAGAIGAIALSFLACSVIVETRSQQCASNTDCAGFGSDAVCDPQSHACIHKADLICDQGSCVCHPTAPVDLLNGCTNAERHCFDDAAHHVEAGRTPPTSKPPDQTPLGVEACNGGGSGGSAGAGGSPGTGGGTGGTKNGTGGSGTGGALPTTACEDLDPQPVYMIGPDSIKPLLSWVAQYYAKDTATVVYQDQSSCVAVDKAYGGAQSGDTNGAFMQNDVGFTSYFDGDGNEHACVIKKKNILPDVFISDVFARTCGDYGLNGSSDVSDDFGPVQAFGFAAPLASSEESIDYAAARLVYGFGSDSHVTPWDDQRYIYERNPSSGTQAMIAKLLNLGADRLRATVTRSTPDEAGLLACATQANRDKTIGILAADVVQETPAIKLLAYQHTGQSCGYLPDSRRGANDKNNVRDGHYFIWGPIHLMTQKRQHSSEVSNLIKYVSGTIPVPKGDRKTIYEHWAKAHLVPQCAMRVQRDTEVGELTPYSPADSCVCPYQAAVSPDGESGCEPCDGTKGCSTFCDTTYGCEPP